MQQALALVVGVILGFWIKNQLNEGKNPFITIRDFLTNIIYSIRGWVMYCFKKIPKRNDNGSL